MDEKKTLDLIVEAYTTSEYADGPGWARIELHQGLMNRIAALSKLCQEQRLARVATYDTPAQWDLEEELRLRDDVMTVTTRDLWFEAYPKHGNDQSETRALHIETLEKAWLSASAEMPDLKAAGLPESEWVLADGRLYHSAAGDVQGLREMYLESVEEAWTDEAGEEPGQR